MVRTSVLINNRDYAPFLRQCLDSVFAQTVPPDEIIVHDDGSTDGSVEILASYGMALRVIHGTRANGTPMANQARAIAAAFAASTGDLIFLLDADDVMAPQHLARYRAAFDATPGVIMVQAPLWKIDSRGRVTGIEYDARRHAGDYLDHIHETHEVNIYYPTSALAFRRSYLERRLPLEDDPGVPLWPDARLALLAPHFGSVVTLEEPLTYWRRYKVAKRTPVYEQVRLSRRYYNAYCAARGLPTVRSWRSPQHVWRWLRHICPSWLAPSMQRLFVKPRPTDLAAQQWLQRGLGEAR